MKILSLKKLLCPTLLGACLIVSGGSLCAQENEAAKPEAKKNSQQKQGKWQRGNRKGQRGKRQGENFQNMVKRLERKLKLSHEQQLKVLELRRDFDYENAKTKLNAQKTKIEMQAEYKKETPDESRLINLAREESELKVKTHIAGRNFFAKFLDLLTAEQRAEFDTLKKERDSKKGAQQSIKLKELRLRELMQSGTASEAELLELSREIGELRMKMRLEQMKRRNEKRAQRKERKEKRDTEKTPVDNQ